METDQHLTAPAAGINRRVTGHHAPVMRRPGHNSGRKGEIEMKKVYDEAVIAAGERFAILVDEETRTAYEAVWDDGAGRWETDFSYHALKTDAMDVAEALDFTGARAAGYRFPDDAEEEV